MELRLGATVQLDATDVKVDAGAQPATGVLRGTVTRLDGDTVEAAATWGSFTCKRAAITKHSAGPPGTCVLWSGTRTGVLLGWRDGSHLVREGAADVTVETESIQKTVPAAQNLRVRTLFGDGVASNVDSTTSVY